MADRLQILGAGDHATTVVSAALFAGFDIVACYDDDPARIGSDVLGIPVVGPIEQAPIDELSIMALGSNEARREYVERTSFRYATVVHPNVQLAQEVSITEGAVVLSGALAQPGNRIGAHAVIGAGAILSHDDTIGRFTHIGPGVTLAGRVTVEDGAFIGTGASVIPGVTIGERAIVGAGAVVIADVPPNTTVVGSPARPIRP